MEVRPSYSDYFEVDLLQDATTEPVIKATKSRFAQHGIADMITDNGPQYSSDQFAAFTREWEFQHTTSSPLHSQSNGKAESAVKIAKNLVKKAKRENKDLQIALLEWRNTPDINNLKFVNFSTPLALPDLVRQGSQPKHRIVAIQCALIRSQSRAKLFT